MKTLTVTIENIQYGNFPINFELDDQTINCFRLMNVQTDEEIHDWIFTEMMSVLGKRYRWNVIKLKQEFEAYISEIVYEHCVSGPSVYLDYGYLNSPDRIY